MACSFGRLLFFKLPTHTNYGKSLERFTLSHLNRARQECSHLSSEVAAGDPELAPVMYRLESEMKEMRFTFTKIERRDCIHWIRWRAT